MNSGRIVLAIALLLPSTAPADVADLTAKAEKGDAEAMYQLGKIHADGTQAKRDNSEALKWYQKAASRDHARSQFELGLAYSEGKGVKQDQSESIRWFRRSALAGNPSAEYYLGLIYLEGKGVEKDSANGASLLFASASQGNPRAQCKLAELYETSDGVEKDSRKAIRNFNLAAAHPEMKQLLGEEAARKVIEKRDEYQNQLSETERKELKEWLAGYRFLMPMLHPRAFGSPGGIGPSRGWYIWRKFDEKTGMAELSNEGTGETFTASVLPWGSTYRHLNYGPRPENLLPGERVNAFFNPDQRHRRGILVHFQDEICQMKGHGHFWQIKSLAKEGDGFTAIVMAGDKPLDPKERVFQIDLKCRIYQSGKAREKFPFAANDKTYLTWCLENENRVVKFACDDASLETIKKLEYERLQKEIDYKGMTGWVESWDGSKLHILIFARHWQQMGALKDQQKLTLKSANDMGEPTGEAIEAKLFFRKNRGTYGSGVTDAVVELSDPAGIKAVRQWPAPRMIAVFPIR